jgi:hypothetical protein
MCNANATGHVIGSKTPTEFRVQCRTAERVYGPVIVGRPLTTDPLDGFINTCPNCMDVFTSDAHSVQDSNGHIVEAN